VGVKSAVMDGAREDNMQTVTVKINIVAIRDGEMREHEIANCMEIKVPGTMESMTRTDRKKAVTKGT
jgi:hypothetical protein